MDSVEFSLLGSRCRIAPARTASGMVWFDDQGKKRDGSSRVCVCAHGITVIGLLDARAANVGKGSRRCQVDGRDASRLWPGKEQSCRRFVSEK